MTRYSAEQPQLNLHLAKLKMPYRGLTQTTRTGSFSEGPSVTLELLAMLYRDCQSSWILNVTHSRSFCVPRHRGQKAQGFLLPPLSVISKKSAKYSQPPPGNIPDKCNIEALNEQD